MLAKLIHPELFVIDMKPLALPGRACHLRASRRCYRPGRHPPKTQSSPCFCRACRSCRHRALPDTFATILSEIRLPRVALAALTGASLAAAGTTYQGLFRNPLADPYLVGVASGAGLGATIALTFQIPNTFIGMSLVPVGAFVGAILTVALVVLSAQVGRTTPISTMLLAGVAVGAFTSAFTTFLMLRSPEVCAGRSTGCWAATAAAAGFRFRSSCRTSSPACSFCSSTPAPSMFCSWTKNKRGSWGSTSNG